LSGSLQRPSHDQCVPPITGPTEGFATGVPDLVSSLADLADDGVYDLAIPE
jgi:hypothetical protein